MLSKSTGLHRIPRKERIHARTFEDSRHWSAINGDKPAEVRRLSLWSRPCAVGGYNGGRKTRRCRRVSGALSRLYARGSSGLGSLSLAEGLADPEGKKTNGNEADHDEHSDGTLVVRGPVALGNGGDGGVHGSHCFSIGKMLAIQRILSSDALEGRYVCRDGVSMLSYCLDKFVKFARDPDGATSDTAE